MTVLDRIRAVLTADAQAIARVTVDERHEYVVHWLAHCKGTVITTGMGKAGIIARKMAATLCSIGTPSVYVHPGDAAHGDLGMVGPHDVIVAFSTSGKTTEVLEMLDGAKRLYPVLSIVGITSHADAPLRDRCHMVLDMGTIEEPCPIGLTPSASAAVMLAIADALALAVADVKGLTREQFGARHRAGYLGQVASATLR